MRRSRIVRRKKGNRTYFVKENNSPKKIKRVIKTNVKVSSSPKTNQAYLNIVTRTSGRPNAFRRCYNSVKAQTYPNIRHIVSIDNLEDKSYVENLDVDYYFIDRAELEAKPDIPDPKTGKKFPFNLYFNELFSKITDGWVLILDDDDFLANEGVVEQIMARAKKPTDLVCFQMEYPNGGKLPSVSELGNQPRIGRIGSPCVTFHHSLTKDNKFDGWKCGDFRFINRLWGQTLEKKVIPKGLISLGGAGFGLRKDIQAKVEVKPQKKMNTTEGFLDHFRSKFGDEQKKSRVKSKIRNRKGWVNKPYKKITNTDFDVVIISGSFNRYDKITRQIKQFQNQDEHSRFSYKQIILNDGSPDKKYKDIPKLFPHVTYLENKKPNGKQGYWRTITKLLQEAKKYRTHTILQIDDDFILCENFLNRLMDKYFELKHKDNRYLGVSYHLYGKNHRTETRWGCPNGNWADGGCLYDVRFIKELNYRIKPIAKTRWLYNKGLSSGVWEQTSNKVRTMNGLIYKTEYSLVDHDGLIFSSIGRRKKQPNSMNTYKFIDKHLKK